MAEDRGRTVRVFPGLKALRYLLPFRPGEEAIAFLRESARRHPGGMAAMGDDCEKFGGWPGTNDHCYREGWLDRFFTALEESAEWLAVKPPGEYIRERQPLGRADLPTASYSEMMEWTLPIKARSDFHAISQEFANRPDVQRFLRGGHWRAFFSKYPESNLLHKKMLRVSERHRDLASKRMSEEKSAKYALAQKHLLRAQCNDAYWHGVFGGIYAPHLRTELWRELIRAESLLDDLRRGRTGGVHIEQTDLDADGCEELYVTSKSLAALLRPNDGGTLASRWSIPCSAGRRPITAGSAKPRPAGRDRWPPSTIRCAARKMGWSAFCATIAGPEMLFVSCSFPRIRLSRITKN